MLTHPLIKISGYSFYNVDLLRWNWQYKTCGLQTNDFIAGNQNCVVFRIHAEGAKFRKGSQLFDEMTHCLRLRPSLAHHFKAPFVHYEGLPKIFQLRVRSCSIAPENTRRLVAQVKEKLENDHNNLPVGKDGRDDEEMILWFLKDRKFSVEDTISKLSKAIGWRKDFGVSDLSEKSVKRSAETGKAYLHNYLDVQDRPVLIVEASKHFPGEQEPYEDQKLCVFLIEKALHKLPAGKQELLVIIDLRGFRAQNADIKFVTFVFDAFYNYYPSRLGQVLFVDAPFIFKPLWEIIKPLLKSYASLVRFCSVKAVNEEYFTADTVPASLRE